jgi:K+-sensing histidine kinase KdpD
MLAMLFEDKMSQLQTENLSLRQEVAKLQEQLAQAHKQVSKYEQLEQLRETFQISVLHQLRTPLTTIVFQSQLVLRDSANVLTAESLASIQSIVASAKNLLSVVESIRDDPTTTP